MARNHSIGNCFSKLWISCCIVVLNNLLTFIHICVMARTFQLQQSPRMLDRCPFFTVEIRCQYIVNGSEISFILNPLQNRKDEKDEKKTNLFCRLLKFKATLTALTELRVNSVACFLRITFRSMPDAWLNALATRNTHNICYKSTIICASCVYHIRIRIRTSSFFSSSFLEIRCEAECVFLYHKDRRIPEIITYRLLSTIAMAMAMFVDMFNAGNDSNKSIDVSFCLVLLMVVHLTAVAANKLMAINSHLIPPCSVYRIQCVVQCSLYSVQWQRESKMYLQLWNVCCDDLCVVICDGTLFHRILKNWTFNR